MRTLQLAFPAVPPAALAAGSYALFVGAFVLSLPSLLTLALSAALLNGAIVLMCSALVAVTRSWSRRVIGGPTDDERPRVAIALRLASFVWLYSAAVFLLIALYVRI